MEAVVNTVRGLWKAQDPETFSQKSIQKRKTNCIAGQWLYLMHHSAAQPLSCVTVMINTTKIWDPSLQKMAPRKQNHRVHPCVASRRRAILKKLSICTLLYLLEQAVFSGFIFRRAYFWLEKCEQEARSCTCHSPRTILATASIFDMLVLYQLLLKCTKCQYVEQTVSLLFSRLRKHETRPLCISIL